MTCAQFWPEWLMAILWSVPAETHSGPCMACPMTSRTFGKVATAWEGDWGKIQGCVPSLVSEIGVTLWLQLKLVNSPNPNVRVVISCREWMAALDILGTNHIVFPHLFWESSLLLHICSQEVSLQKAPPWVQVTGSKYAAALAASWGDVGREAGMQRHAILTYNCFPCSL